MSDYETIVLINVFVTLFGFLCGWLTGLKLAYDRLYIEAKLKEKNNGT